MDIQRQTKKQTRLRTGLRTVFSPILWGRSGLFRIVSTMRNSPDRPPKVGQKLVRRPVRDRVCFRLSSLISGLSGSPSRERVRSYSRPYTPFPSNEKIVRSSETLVFYDIGRGGQFPLERGECYEVVLGNAV